MNVEPIDDIVLAFCEAVSWTSPFRFELACFFNHPYSLRSIPLLRKEG